MIITINEINLNVDKTSAAGKAYTAHEVKYTNGNGKTLTKLIFSSSAIAPMLPELKPGDNADVTTQKNGKFFEWVSIKSTTEAPKAYSGGGFTAAPKAKFDTLGATIGNISNCASAIYAAKLAPSLKEAVDTVLEAHEYIRAKLEAPAAEVKAEPAKKVEPTTFEVVEDDTAF